MRRSFRLVCAAASLAAGLVPLSALAFRGGGGNSDAGDSYLNDAVRNPRFIEPRGYNDPARYRMSNPRAGYEDRQLSAEGFYNYGSGRPDARRYRGETYYVPYHAQ